MFKKVFGAVMALAFVFGMATQSELSVKISNACSAMCCEHNGDVWDW